MKEEKQPNSINVLTKKVYEDDLAYHMYYSLDKLYNLIYHKPHKFVTLMDHKFIIPFESGINRDEKYNTTRLKNISGEKINFLCMSNEEKDILYYHKLIMVRTYSEIGWLDMNSSSYSFNCSYFTYGKKQYLMWIKRWSKNLKKRIIKYLYKLQQEKYSDQALITFFTRLNRNFKFMMMCNLDDEIENGREIGIYTPYKGKSEFKILKIIPIISTTEYRNVAINKLVS